MHCYLGRINDKYRRLSGLVYEMYHHPVTHIAHPSNIKLANGQLILWAIQKGVNPRKRRHLINDRGALVIDLNQFIDDLGEAVELFFKDVVNSPSRTRQVKTADRKLTVHERNPHF